MYNDAKWMSSIQNAVAATTKAHAETNPTFTNKGWRDYPHNIALAGMYKDATSYYINSFPQWDNSIAISPDQGEGDILSATKIRRQFFTNESGYIKDMPTGSHIAMDYIINTEDFVRLNSDWKYENSYEAIYGKGPHHTVDSCIVEAGHVLLIQRGKEYGHGLWAMPGGFMNRRERIQEAMLRELVEETEIKVPHKVLRGSIARVENYDDPFRSNRSHIITTAYRINLEHHKEFPKVKGCDDAMDAKWIPISQIPSMKEVMFEDHYDMLDDLLGL
jgi:bifunctional NMN adenylyltransferase/nudix hydrolase